MAFSHISQHEYKSTNYLFISTTNRLLLIPLTMNADNHDASEVSSPSCSDSLQFATGAKGSKQAMHNGYVYCINRRNEDKGLIYWACKDRKLFTPACKGRLTSCGDEIVKVTAHCHEGSENNVGVQQFLSNLRNTTSAETPANVVRNLLLSTPVPVQTHLQSMQSLKRRITNRRRRERGFPLSEATCATEFSLPLPSITETRRGVCILADTTTARNKRLIAIASEATLGILNQHQTYLYMDGTFKISPKYFRQLWIICGHVLDSPDVTPLAYFLLEDQHTSSYTKALQILVQHCPRLTVATVLCDFEQAEHNAMQEVFPDTAIQGCLFHWKQALRQFVKISEFHQDNTVKEDLQSIYGLAFIPEDAVLNTWEALKTQLYANPALLNHSILEYVENTWIKSAVYPVKMWNVHQAVLTGGPRTNNYSEGNNNALSRAVGCSNPSGGLLAETLKRFNAEAELNIQQSITGLTVATKKRKKYLDLNERIIRAVQNYGRVSNIMFCKCISNLV